MVAEPWPLIGQNVTTPAPDWLTWSYLTPPESLTQVFVPRTSHWCVELLRPEMRCELRAQLRSGAAHVSCRPLGEKLINAGVCITQPQPGLSVKISSHDSIPL